MREHQVEASSVTAYTVVLLLALAAVAAGCGDDDPPPVNNPTATIPAATPTPTPSDPAHTENLFGSTEPGGGALTLDAAAEVDVSFSSCIGGTGDGCVGGTVLYTATDPGFEEAEEDEPDEPLYTLVDGVTVRLEITATDPGVSLKLDAQILNAAGQSAVLGTTPGVHRDLEWQLALPGGEVASRQVSLRLVTTAPQYSASDVVTVTLRPAEGG